MRQRKILKLLTAAIASTLATIIISYANHMSGLLGASRDETMRTHDTDLRSSPSLSKSNDQLATSHKQINEHIRNDSSKDSNKTIPNYVQFKKVYEAIKIVERQEAEYFKLRKDTVNPIDEEILIENRQLCEQDAEAPYLLIVVPSIPGDSMIRVAMRTTIGSYVSGSLAQQLQTEHSVTIKLVFVVGSGPTDTVDELLKEEHAKHRDILQAKFTDTYRNLTRKMLISLKWIANYCSNVDYIMKLDEDVFVNIPALIPKLKSQRMDPYGTILGHIYPSGQVHRHGKWKVTKEQYPLNKYPTYASGNSYVISGNLLPRFVRAAEHFPYIPIEDAFITGCLAKLTRVKMVSVPGFSQWTDKKPEPCLFFMQKKVTGTKVTVDLWHRLWDIQRNYRDKCLNTSR